MIRMNGQRKVLTLLGVAALGVAVLVWQVGVKGANDVVALVGTFVTAAAGVLSLVEATRRRTAPGTGDGPGAEPAQAPAGRSRRAAGNPRTYRRLLPLGVAVLLLVVVGALAFRWPLDGPPDATGGSAEPTGAAPTTSGPPWIPPATAPTWTLTAGDSVSFLPEPQLKNGGGGGLVFQPQWAQLAWYHWTDDPKDLSYAGCRNPKAQRWDSIDLRQVGRKPRTYCQPDPADPAVVNYVRIMANHWADEPPSVQVRVWSFRP
jgi:hypothetical protein